MPRITYSTPSGPLPGYMATPSAEGPWPGVVIVQDVLGMTADLRRTTDRFAEAGYLAFAPALYGGGRNVKCMIRAIRTIREHFAGEGVAYDVITAARDYLADDKRCTGKIGLAGFCMGAGFCLQLSPRGRFDVVASNYGLPPKAIEILEKSCPVVASYGAKDRIVKAGAAAALEAVLERGDVPRDIKEYPNVAHSFMNNWEFPGPIRVIENITGMAYSRPEAEDAWQRMLAFFAEYLS